MPHGVKSTELAGRAVPQFWKQILDQHGISHYRHQKNRRKSQPLKQKRWTSGNSILDPRLFIICNFGRSGSLEEDVPPNDNNSVIWFQHYTIDSIWYLVLGNFRTALVAKVAWFRSSMACSVPISAIYLPWVIALFPSHQMWAEKSPDRSLPPNPTTVEADIDPAVLQLALTRLSQKTAGELPLPQAWTRDLLDFRNRPLRLLFRQLRVVPLTSMYQSIDLHQTDEGLWDQRQDEYKIWSDFDER